MSSSLLSCQSSKRVCVRWIFIKGRLLTLDYIFFLWWPRTQSTSGWRESWLSKKKMFTEFPFFFNVMVLHWSTVHSTSVCEWDAQNQINLNVTLWRSAFFFFASFIFSSCLSTIKAMSDSNVKLSGQLFRSALPPYFMRFPRNLALGWA